MEPLRNTVQLVREHKAETVCVVVALALTTLAALIFARIGPPIPGSFTLFKHTFTVQQVTQYSLLALSALLVGVAALKGGLSCRGGAAPVNPQPQEEIKSEEEINSQKKEPIEFRQKEVYAKPGNHEKKLAKQMQHALFQGVQNGKKIQSEREYKLGSRTGILFFKKLYEKYDGDEKKGKSKLVVPKSSWCLRFVETEKGIDLVDPQKPGIGYKAEKNEKIGAAVSYDMWARPSMQDGHAMVDLGFGHFYGVFDGHGESLNEGENTAGALVAKHLEKVLPEKMKEVLGKINLQDEGAVADGITRVFKEVDEEIKRDEKLVNGGATGCCALRIGNRVYFANVGDSRAILVSKDENNASLQVTRDQKPTDAKYAKAIEKLGGSVDGGRLNGGLSPGGAFGDGCIVNEVDGKMVFGVPSRPDVTVVEIGDSAQSNYAKGKVVAEVGDRLVIACDGLWDVISPVEAGYLVHKCAKAKYSNEQIAQYLVKAAIMNGSNDNISVMVVSL